MKIQFSHLFAVVIVGLVAFLGGFAATVPTPSGLDATGGTDWNDIAGPVDYSASLDRFILEVAELQFFGKTPAKLATSSKNGAEAESDATSDVPRLLGIAVLDGQRVALLTDAAGKPVRMIDGQALDNGWQVTGIDLNFVTISRDNGDMVLNLYKPGLVRNRD